MALAPNALTDVETVRQELGLASGIDQAMLERHINAASGAIERYCGRILVYRAGAVEACETWGDPRLIIDATPIATIGQIEIDGAAVDPTTYRVDDADAGLIWRDGGWAWSALIRPGFNFTNDQQPGTENKRTTVYYAGGYITSPQAYGAAAWPGASKAVAPGTLLKPAAQPAQLWRASVAGRSASCGTFEPVWPSSPATGQTVTDGAVTWAYLGTAGAAGSPGTAMTLPGDLEQAALYAVRSFYRTRNDNPNVVSESLLGASVSYAPRTGLPADAVALAATYRRFT